MVNATEKLSLYIWILLTTGSETKAEDKSKQKKGRKKHDAKQDKPEPILEENDENLDLASVVKRRRLLAAKTKAEKEEQQKLEREK